MKGESKAWMSPGKTEDVYLLKFQKNRGANPSHPSAFSHSGIFIPRLK